MNRPLDSTHLHTDDVPEGESKGFRHKDEDLFAVKKNGKLFVYRNRCPHLDVALHWQNDQFLDASKTMIQCANHGALFVIENGKCVSGPCSGRKLISISVDIIDGVIFPHEH